jgi:hypothetical protein
MGEFYAWAMTGQVTGLEVWADTNDRPDTDDQSEESGSVRIANRMLEQQKFKLRSRDGREMEIHLIDSGMDFRNGQVATVAWAAREGAIHGHCIFVKNHTTGATARLKTNLRHVRSEVKTSKIVGFGMLATVPAALAILAWLLTPGSLAEIELGVFLVGASVALVVLFSVGAIVAKLVFDYLRSEDDNKIWKAVDKALAASIHQPRPQRYDSRIPYRA